MLQRMLAMVPPGERRRIPQRRHMNNIREGMSFRCQRDGYTRQKEVEDAYALWRP